MNLRYAAPVAMLAVLALAAQAQTDETTPPQREEDLNLTLPTDEWYVPKNTLQFGYRVLGKGAKVGFGNLGSVASIRTIIAASQGDAGRQYDNGFVTRDSLRANEMKRDADGNLVLVDGQPVANYAPDTRYQFYRTNTDGSQTLTLDYLAYTPGKTREWGYEQESQVNGGVLALSNYSARSEGASASKDEGANGGMEISLSRTMGRVGQRFEWSLTAGLALNNMAAKTAGTVQSTLLTYTDYFTLDGPTPTRDPLGNLGGPTFRDAMEADGTTVANVNGIETTTRLSGAPTLPSTQSEVAGAATVQGNWKIKGAYFLMRVGPSLRAQFSDRWGMSASVGLAGAYAGSRYSVIEQLQIPDVIDPIIEEKSSTSAKFLPGFYADVSLDWLATERTGLFAGVNMQHLGGYDQEVAGRTAKIDLGSAVGLRGGISIKF